MRVRTILEPVEMIYSLVLVLFLQLSFVKPLVVKSASGDCLAMSIDGDIIGSLGVRALGSGTSSGGVNSDILVLAEIKFMSD